MLHALLILLTPTAVAALTTPVRHPRRVSATAAGFDKLYYQVHIPKSGGTTVANMILADICEQGLTSVGSLEFGSACSFTCRAALVDSEFSCADPYRWEHMKWDLLSIRVKNLTLNTGVNDVMYITSLRSGTERVVSQWAHEIYFGAWLPPPSVPALSNESLLLYIQGGIHQGQGWIARGSASQRNNYHVATLAGVPGRENVTRAHLEIAKQRLMNGSWLIGFTDCMPELHRRLQLLGRKSESPSPLSSPVIPFTEHRKPDTVQFSMEVVKELNKLCELDNELYYWALLQSQKDDRFAGPCSVDETQLAGSFSTRGLRVYRD